MKKLAKLILGLLCLFPLIAHSSNVTGLLYEISSGNMAVISTQGTGASSGSAINGYLVNKSANQKNINVYLDEPIYFKNSGGGQNMIATQIYNKGGRYRSDGKNSFITIKSGERKEITFIAYCVDFEKENPTSYESFSITPVPNNIKKLFNGILLSKESNIVAIQLALWIAQGESTNEIKKKFNFSYSDEILARQLIKLHH